MRKFSILDENLDSYIFLLVKEDAGYRFVNMSTACILNEIFVTPSQALNWLDLKTFEWHEVEF